MIHLKEKLKAAKVEMKRKDNTILYLKQRVAALEKKYTEATYERKYTEALLRIDDDDSSEDEDDSSEDTVEVVEMHRPLNRSASSEVDIIVPINLTLVMEVPDVKCVACLKDKNVGFRAVVEGNSLWLFLCLW